MVDEAMPLAYFAPRARLKLLYSFGKKARGGRRRSVAATELAEKVSPRSVAWRACPVDLSMRPDRVAT